MLSYARQDQPFARRIHRQLLNRGFEVWVDWERLEGAIAWLAHVKRAIEAATCFGFVLSHHALRSANCRLELLHARRCQVPVVCFQPGGFWIAKDLPGEIPARQATKSAKRTVLAYARRPARAPPLSRRKRKQEKY